MCPLMPCRYIGLLTYEILFDVSTRMLWHRPEPAPTQCHDLYFKAAAHMRRSPVYRQWAQDFTKLYLPNDGRYIAIHVRYVKHDMLMIQVCMLVFEHVTCTNSSFV